MSKNLQKNLLYFALVILIFGFDRISKILILNIFEDQELKSFQIMQNINFNLVWNNGIAFGLLSLEKSLYYNLLTFIIIFITIIVLVLAYKSPNKLEKICFLMIVGGSSGNIFDRVYYSSVIDFIDITVKNFSWFVFNIADIFISVGIFVLIFSEFLKKKNEKF